MNKENTALEHQPAFRGNDAIKSARGDLRPQMDRAIALDLFQKRTPSAPPASPAPLTGWKGLEIEGSSSIPTERVFGSFDRLDPLRRTGV